MKQTKILTYLANHLIQEGLLNQDLAIHYQNEAMQTDTHFVHYLVKNNILCSNTVFEVCKKAFHFPTFDMKHYNINWLHQSSLNPDIILKYRVIPLQKMNHVLHVGLSDPTDKYNLDLITFHAGMTVVPTLIQENQIIHFLKIHIENLMYKKLELSLLKEINQEENNYTVQDNTVNYDEPLVRFVDHLISHSLKQTASDIHIEPHEDKYRIRYRCDGILHETAEVPINLATRLVTRLKVMAKLDISERRLPQDGRFHSHQIDIRMSTCPTLFGEKVVLRLLDSNQISLNIDELGFNLSQKKLFIDKISQPQGLILVTGPTGSGKTVTLYSALQYLNNHQKNISTVEDPIEIQIKGINQVNIHSKIGLHFSTVLRTFLRQDPDIIMVGEIRDTETAEIAIQAAQTGHLVLSTLHTNNAFETLYRLQSMGIPFYNICATTSLIIAQRLVRKLCDYCKQSEITSPDILQQVGFSHIDTALTLYQAKGCDYCLQGYQGRTGIYELLPMTKEITQSLLLSQPPHPSSVENSFTKDFFSLRAAGLEKIMQGITSLNELNRVLTR